jgi:hypothetical protein
MSDRSLLTTALVAAQCPETVPEARMLRGWLDSWSGVGHVVESMHELSYDVRLSSPSRWRDRTMDWTLYDGLACSRCGLPFARYRRASGNRKTAPCDLHARPRSALRGHIGQQPLARPMVRR